MPGSIAERHYRGIATSLGLLWAGACLLALLLVPAPQVFRGLLRIFWGGVVPALFVVLVVVGHEHWRRACPLAFWARVGQALANLGPRRCSPRRHHLRRVPPHSWLGRYHVWLQAAILWLGLVIRLLLVEWSVIGFAVLCLVTMAAALACGWLLPGRAWCHYLCPMGPVEGVVVGLRGLFGSQAHRLPKGTPGQSTCRTPGPNGEDGHGCVQCQSPCLDIDAERTYWLHLRHRHSVNHFAWCYPGLVMAFFHYKGQLATGALASPWIVPIGLLMGSILSWCAWAVLHRLGLSLHHTRLLARFTAVAVLLLAVDPTLGLGGAGPCWALRLTALTALGLTLVRDWNRTAQHHAREALAASLQRHGPRLHHEGERLLRAITADLRHHTAAWPSQEMEQLQHRLAGRPRER